MGCWGGGEMIVNRGGRKVYNEELTCWWWGDCVVLEMSVGGVMVHAHGAITWVNQLTLLKDLRSNPIHDLVNIASRVLKV